MNTNNPASHKRGVRLIPFLCALMCFALPFVQVSCTDRTIPMTGIECVTKLMVPQDGSASQQTKVTEIVVHVIFGVSVMFAVLAAAFCFVPGFIGKLGPAILGLLALLTLLLAKSTFENFLKKEGQGLIQYDWQFGFYASCTLLLIGALASGFHFVLGMQKPPINSSAVY